MTDLVEMMRDDKGRFVKGASGNPVGRPSGVPNNGMASMVALIKDDLPRALELFRNRLLNDDPWALSFYMQRIWPLNGSLSEELKEFLLGRRDDKKGTVGTVTPDVMTRTCLLGQYGVHLILKSKMTEERMRELSYYHLAAIVERIDRLGDEERRRRLNDSNDAMLDILAPPPDPG